MNEFLHDTHAHLDLLVDPDSIIQAIERRKIYTIAVTNLPALYRKMTTQINSRFIRPALGFHPELLGKFENAIPQMWDSLEQARYVGEVGIDLKVATSSKELQIGFFTELIHRCNMLGGKILTIHSRGAADLVVDIIGSRFSGKFILHWYSGSLKTLEQTLRNGAYISINYAMTQSHSGIRIIQAVPSERLLLESDSPFVVIGGKCYDTLCMNLVVEQLSKIKNVPYETMISQLHNNFKLLIS